MSELEKLFTNERCPSCKSRMLLSIESLYENSTEAYAAVFNYECPKCGCKISGTAIKNESSYSTDPKTPEGGHIVPVTIVE